MQQRCSNDFPSFCLVPGQLTPVVFISWSTCLSCYSFSAFLFTPARGVLLAAYPTPSPKDPLTPRTPLGASHGRHYYYHSTYGQTQVQKGAMICPRPQRQQEQKWDQNLGTEIPSQCFVYSLAPSCLGICKFLHDVIRFSFIFTLSLLLLTTSRKAGTGLGKLRDWASNT